MEVLGCTRSETISRFVADDFRRSPLLSQRARLENPLSSTTADSQQVFAYALSTLNRNTLTKSDRVHTVV